MLQNKRICSEGDFSYSSETRGVREGMAEFMRVRNMKAFKARVKIREKDYKGLYMFSEENVEWIAKTFLGVSTDTRGGALSSTEKMKTFLRYLGDPGFQTGVGEDVGIAQSTVSKTIKQVMWKVVQQANMWIRFPREGQLERAKGEWQGRYSFPSTIGVLDCTHVQITKPATHGDENLNRKGFASINVQATCNALE